MVSTSDFATGPLSSNRQRKRLLLHIGQHKTGTTSIQAALTRLRGELAEAGVLYPTTGCPEWAGLAHHLLPWSIVQPQARPTVRGRRAEFEAGDADRLWNALHEEIAASPAATIVISSEEFDTLRAGEIADLRRRLEPYEVVPVLFARRASAVVESNYCTEVLYMGFAEGMREFVREGRCRTDLGGLVDDWRTLATGGEMLILSYDEPAIKDDAVRALLQLLDLETLADRAGVEARLNQRMPAFVCEAARHLRSLAVSDHEIVAWAHQVQRRPLLADVGERYTCMPPDLGAELDEHYAGDVHRLIDDPATSALMRGDFDVLPYQARGEFIDGPAAALVALGRELSRRDVVVQS